MTTPMVHAGAKSRWRSFAVLVALSIGAAACGSTETSSTPTLATQTAPETTPADTAPETTPDESPEDAAVESSADDSSAEDEPEEAAPVVNLFPDIDVLNIADGATVNLAAELGGGDKATLLWFFAPH